MFSSVKTGAELSHRSRFFLKLCYQPLTSCFFKVCTHSTFFNHKSSESNTNFFSLFIMDTVTCLLIILSSFLISSKSQLVFFYENARCFFSFWIHSYAKITAQYIKKGTHSTSQFTLRVFQHSHCSIHTKQLTKKARGPDDGRTAEVQQPTTQEHFRLPPKCSQY